MHIRTSRVNRNGKVYEYAQLVQSFRRESDGMPTQRVVETLGPPDSIEVLNMRAALAAAKAGKRVVVATAPRRAERTRPKANLRYLDIAVLLELWRDWGLDEIRSRTTFSSSTSGLSNGPRAKTVSPILTTVARTE